VFSPRYDVDRAITNMPKILRLEQEHGALSTAYVRVFHPFYTDDDIRWLDSLPHPVDIQLHAEFVAHAPKRGTELAAAQADRAHLEGILDRSVSGVAPHGGEFIDNATDSAYDVIESCGFTWVAEFYRGYYFPYRRLDQDGNLKSTYFLPCQFHDVRVDREQYAIAFFDKAMNRLDLATEQGGVLLLMMHPGYFGFFSYLLKPKNLVRFLRFMPAYLSRVAGLARGQIHLNRDISGRLDRPAG
jgi:hypothetical protein